MRSKLFVPGSRPELFPKALAGEADALSFDLEDAVDEARKDEARQHLAAFLRERGSHGKTIVVRVNGIDTLHFQADLEAVTQPGLDIVNLPKVEDPEQVREAARLLDRIEAEQGRKQPLAILANIESPLGLRHAAAIATADKRVMGLQIGFGDLLAPLGISQRNALALSQTRWAVRLAAGEAGIAAYDGAFVDIADRDGYLAEAREAMALGFSGKSCIHPSQVALANTAFRPSDEELAHALRVVKASDEAAEKGVGAFVVDGKLIDGPFIVRARQLAELGRRLGLA